MEPLLLGVTPTEGWKTLVEKAEQVCHYQLSVDLESYLIFMLMRFIKQPELVESVFALEYLQIQDVRKKSSRDALQQVGDKCLLFSGFFPGAAKRKRVHVSYFVELGQTAYYNLSAFTRLSEAQLFEALCKEFVALMDVLQTMRELGGETPIDYLQAIELWHDTHSPHAKAILAKVTAGLPTWFEETEQKH